MTTQAQRLYNFGPFQLDTGTQVLRRDGKSVPLKPKLLELLILLVESSGRIVRKDELIKHFWPDTFVEEGNLPVSVCELRKALGEVRGDRQYIETVPRRGYRFVARVSEAGEASVQLDRGDPSAEVTSNRAAGWANGTIAVLPFKAIGMMGDQYLALGMADALITRLSNLRQITIRPTSSVRKYDREQDPVVAGRDLRVEWVLEGSVQKSGKRIRVTVQLVSVGDGLSLWAETFDEKFTNIFAVEDSISKLVAAALAPKLSIEERRLLAKRHTENAEAYQGYLKGRYFLEKRTEAAFRKAIGCFEDAIQIDPSFALAYSGLADCYICLYSYARGPNALRAEAKEKALEALRLDDSLGEAHASLAHLTFMERDWSGAESEFKRAIELNPNYPVAHNWYAVFLRTMGRFDEAIAETRKAQKLDPLSLSVNTQMGSLLYVSRRFDEAILQLLQVVELDPNYPTSHFYLGLAYEAKGMYDEAIREYDQAIVLGGADPELTARVAAVYALSGRRPEARMMLDELKELSRCRHVSHYDIATVHTALGDKEQALASLEKSYEKLETVFALNVDPTLDSLRGEPRFERLLRRLGLPPGK
jgi:DNA-binding winged helix-turn-helix (wHTH) protein/tetratricopeptide (TPR) repeat protein